MKKHKKLLIGLVCVCVMAFAATAYAGTTPVDYSVTIPILGSSYTAYQTKVTTGSAATGHSTVVGADYELQCRQYDSDGNSGDLQRSIGDAQDFWIDGNTHHESGDSVRLRFAVDGGARVRVAASGNWQSN